MEKAKIRLLATPKPRSG